MDDVAGKAVCIHDGLGRRPKAGRDRVERVPRLHDVGHRRGSRSWGGARRRCRRGFGGGRDRRQLDPAGFGGGRRRCSRGRRRRSATQKTLQASQSGPGQSGTDTDEQDHDQDGRTQAPSPARDDAPRRSLHHEPGRAKGRVRSCRSPRRTNRSELLDVGAIPVAAFISTAQAETHLVVAVDGGKRSAGCAPVRGVGARGYGSRTAAQGEERADGLHAPRIRGDAMGRRRGCGRPAPGPAALGGRVKVKRAE